MVRDLNLLRSLKLPSKYEGLSGEQLRKVFRYSVFTCNPHSKKPHLDEKPELKFALTKQII